MTTFVISDQHYGHSRIIQYCNRPFASVEEMDEAMIANHNSVVTDNDTVIFGGDFTFYRKKNFYKALEIFNRLNGSKYLVIGNHDHSDTLCLPWIDKFERYERKHNGKHVVIDHYPIESWNERYHGSVHLYGHVHDKPERTIANRHCICAELVGYTPVNLDVYTNDLYTNLETKQDNT